MNTQTAQRNVPSKVFADIGSSKSNKFDLVNSRKVNRSLKAATLADVQARKLSDSTQLCSGSVGLYRFLHDLSCYQPGLRGFPQ